MAQVEQQRQRRAQQERKGGQQRKPVNRLQRLDVEHAHQRRHDERARHQAGDVGIEHDQHAPQRLVRRLVRIDIALEVRHHLGNDVGDVRSSCYLTSLSMPA